MSISYAVFCLKKKNKSMGGAKDVTDHGCSTVATGVYDASFFFNDTATTEIYTLSLHDALPIPSARSSESEPVETAPIATWARSFMRITEPLPNWRDRKSTRLNSSHMSISY